MWINDATLKTYDYIYEIRNDFESIIFPEYPTNADFEQVGVYEVFVAPVPEYNPMTQDLIALPPEKINNQWIQNWEVTNATPEEIIERENASKEQNKKTASGLLQETDWTATVDISNPNYSMPYLGNQSEFLSYRSAIRKIAVNPPIEVGKWPVKPEEIWIGE